MTNFDLILLLIISEATHNAMIKNDNSYTNAALVILTLVGSDILLTVLKQRFPAFRRWIDGLPRLVLQHGRPLEDLMTKARVDSNDILSSARERHGLERLDQIKYAVLEKNGVMSIVPKSSLGTTGLS